MQCTTIQEDEKNTLSLIFSPNIFNLQIAQRPFTAETNIQNIVCVSTILLPFHKRVVSIQEYLHNPIVDTSSCIYSYTHTHLKDIMYDITTGNWLEITYMYKMDLIIPSATQVNALTRHLKQNSRGCSRVLECAPSFHT